MARQRIERDFYPTEAALTQVLLRHIEIDGDILEPCAGDRAMAIALRGSERNVYCSDIRDAAAGKPADATTREFWGWYDGRNEYFQTEWAITNPPFNAAPAIIPLAYEHSSRGIAMLLRLSYLEPCANRAQWLADHADNLRAIIPVNPRPRFRSDTGGTDSVTVAWFVWDKLHSWAGLGVPCPFIFESGWKEKGYMQNGAIRSQA